LSLTVDLQLSKGFNSCATRAAKKALPLANFLPISEAKTWRNSSQT
jgi:hypothetical protein